MTNNRSSSTTGKVLLASPTPSSAQKTRPTDVVKRSLVPNDLSKTRVISPSGLSLVNGGSNRNTSVSPGRNENSISLISVNSSVVKNKTIVKKADKSPSSARKNVGGVRRSMLPQPMSVLPRPSTSPSVYEI